MKNLDASAPLLSVFTTISQDTDWQNQLRRSVNLYLALGNQPANAQELETLLQHTEEELLHYLLQGERPTPTAIEHAQHVLDMAQNSLLQAEVDKQQLLPPFSTGPASLHGEPVVPPVPTPRPADKGTR